MDLQFRNLLGDFERSSHLAFFFTMHGEDVYLLIVFSLELSAKLLFSNLADLNK